MYCLFHKSNFLCRKLCPFHTWTRPSHHQHNNHFPSAFTAPGGWMDCVTMISITFYATREEITIDTSDKNWANHSRTTYTSPFLTPYILNTHRRRRSQSKQIAADGLNIDAISINTNAELDRTGNGQQKMGNFISAFSVLHPPSLVAVNSIFAVGLVYSILDGANRFYGSPTSQSNQQT